MNKSCMDVEGIQVHITKKSNVKRISIRILPPNGQIKVTAPKKCSDIMIRSFFLSKMEQIRKAVSRVKKESKHSHLWAENQIKEGSIHRLWGKSYVLMFRKGAKNQFFIQGDYLILEWKGDLKEDFKEEKILSLLDRFYRAEMMKVLPQMVEKYTSVVGEVPNEYRIKKMRTRWGTCNIKARRIWLNSELAKKPLCCLEYVVVHELVHLLERYHNRRFYSFLDEFYPDWKRVTQELQQS